MPSSSKSITSYEMNAAPLDGHDSSCSRTIDKRLVHKAYDENVLLSHIEALPDPVALEQSNGDETGRADHFRGIVCVHRDHAFFFERGGGHVPALYLFEAARQMSSAIVHMFYGVPIETEVVVTECSAQFCNMANLNEAIIAEKMTSNHVYRRGRLVSMLTTVVIRQGALEIARLSATLVLLNKKQLDYLEQRGSAPQLNGFSNTSSVF
jgi:A-factor biosynthesis hotdog domain